MTRLQTIIMPLPPHDIPRTPVYKVVETEAAD